MGEESTCGFEISNDLDNLGLCLKWKSFELPIPENSWLKELFESIYFGQILLHWICEGENNPLNVFLIFRELRWKLGSNPTQWESWNPHFKELRFPDKSLNHFSNKSDLIKRRLSLIKLPYKNAEKTITYQLLFWVSIILISRLQHMSAE